MDLAAIDYWAYSGRSRLHEASAGSKLLMTAAYLAALLVAHRFVTLLLLYLLLVALLMVSRLPLLKVLALSTYPIVFSLLFLVSRWNGNWLDSAALLLRTTGAALLVLLLIGTTPYPEIFGLSARVLPQVLADGLYMTYRSLFILLQDLDRLITAFRIRGGWADGSWKRRLENLATALGLLLVQALNRSQRQYAVMVVRGYQGKLAELRPTLGRWPQDALPPCVGATALLAVLAVGG